MELRHLRYFVALAEELNFTRAAAKVHVTQSTLSHQIKQLEDEIGRALFERTGRRVVMTEAGESMLMRLEGVLRVIDDSVRVAKGAGASPSGSLRVATTPSFNAGLMPACLAAFLRQHETVHVTLIERLADAVETEIEAGRIDIGIGYMPSQRTGLSFEPLYIEEMVLAVSPRHELAGRRHLRLAELHRQRLILNTPQSATRRMLEERLAAVNASPVVVAEIDAIQPALELVRASGLATIVSEHVVHLVPGVQAVPLDEPTPLSSPWSSPRSRSG
jgi:LysR family transcriptional regulator, cyn operon transcriptional activator